MWDSCHVTGRVSLSVNGRLAVMTRLGRTYPHVTGAKVERGLRA
jgi:hypothetical protein